MMIEDYKQWIVREKKKEVAERLTNRPLNLATYYVC